MPMKCHALLACLVIGTAAATSGASARTKKQFPFELGFPPPLRPLPREMRRLRGPSPDFDMPLGNMAFRAIPLGAVSFDFPEDVLPMQGPRVYDEPLRDLLNFGSAMGAAVLRPDAMVLPTPHRSFGGAGGGFGEALELPLDSLHVKMQQEVPAPLTIKEIQGTVHIFGTIPKNLTPKTLKVSLSGEDDRDLVIQYFLGKGVDLKNVVGIDERFSLDFSPVDAPAVKYKATTGAFELLLNRPGVDPKKHVAIDFEDSTSKAAKQPGHHKAARVGTVPAKLTKAKDMKVVVQPSKAKSVTEGLARHKNAARQTKQRRASPQEFASESKLTRLHASQARSLHKNLAKVTKTLHEHAQGSSYAKKDKAARVKAATETAKQFVADAHLGAHLADAFAPLDEDLGLVMLEMHHRAHAH